MIFRVFYSIPDCSGQQRSPLPFADCGKKLPFSIVAKTDIKKLPFTIVAKTDIFRFPFPPFTVSGESGERGEEKRKRGVEESVGERGKGRGEKGEG
jgi:hypothetical protein